MSSSWSTLSSVDKQAFYSILDEYFESRPHLFQQQSAGNNTNDNFSALTKLASSNPGMTASALKSAGVPPSLAKSSNVTAASSASKHLNGIGSKVGQLSGKFNNQFINSNSEQPPQPTRTVSSTSNGLPNSQKFGAASTTPSHQNSFAPPPTRRVTPSVTSTHSTPPPRPAPLVSKFPDEELVEAMYDYEGTSPEDLTFKERQVITVTEHISEDWWNGRIGNGPIGMFPSSYVKPI